MYITDMSLVPEKNSSELVSEPSMYFWGITCQEGKKYAQVVGERFRMTMAVLDPNTAPKGISKPVSLVVQRGQHEYLLCILKHEEIQQVNLNLIFDKGENVIFHVKGPGDVCLSGYQLTDSERDFQNDENGYLCPLVEIKPTKSESEDKSPKTPGEKPDSTSPKSKKKAKRERDFVTPDDRKMLNSWNIKPKNRKRNGDIGIDEYNDQSDESDDDFSLGDESSESSESENYNEESEEGLEDEVTKLLEDEYCGEDYEEPIMKIEENAGSRKRKLEKRSKLEENSFSEKDSSDSDVVALSEEETPISKKTKKMDNSSEKKKSKKKKKNKKLNESTLSENSVTENSCKTPKSTGTTPQKLPVMKLKGGIEVTDVRVGRGPVATKGKMVHVLYCGRLENNHVFDARGAMQKPFNFRLGVGEVLKGWDIGLLGMRVGGRRNLVVPADMGYGRTAFKDVPPNSKLFYTIELLAVS